MAFTSDWSFKSIDRGVSSSLAGAAYFSRPSYTIIRERVSNDTFSSSAGTTASSISGYNAGVTETITAPSVLGSYFATTRNWVDSGALWIDSGIQSYGKPVYLQIKGYGNLPTSSLVTAVFFYDTGNYQYLSSAQSQRQAGWYCAQFEPEAILSANFLPLQSNRANGPSYSDNWTVANGDPNAPSDWDVSPYGTYSGAGTFSGSSVFTASQTGSGYFFCSSDRQIYNQSSVDWYTQEQTWIFKGPSAT